MAGYKLATYQTSDGARAGLVIDDKVYDAAKLTGEPDLCERARHPRGLAGGARRPQEGGRGGGKSRVKPLPLARTKLLAPVRWPSAIYCAGANYADHAAEMARRMNRPMEPDPHTPGPQGLAFHQGLARARRPGRDGEDFRRLRPGGLGGRARRR